MMRAQISMTDEQAQGLRRLSAETGTSQAALLREALDVVLARRDRAARIQRALDATGRYRSGDSDTSVDHDAVLGEIYAS